MNLTRGSKIIITSVVIVSIVTIVGAPLLLMSLNPTNPVRVTLLDNAGVMVEADGLRVYIDPINLQSEYMDYPADAVLITHPHEDHYQSAIVDMLQKDETINVFPENMTAAISQHDGTGVDPGDQVQVGHIIITAFYMYTFPVGEGVATHPREANWTSYIIDINGFTLFHAGDSKNLNEYNQLTGSIEVALLPLGPGCQTMAGQEVVDAIHTIQPQWFIPIHYEIGANDQFILDYGSQLTDCEIVNLNYFTSHEFTL